MPRPPDQLKDLHFAYLGHISFFAGPILIADIKLSICVIETESVCLEPEGTYSTVEPYQSVFVSYSHKDSAIVGIMRAGT